MVTINKRETSFQGLAEQFEAGEDNIYNMIANDKNIIFTPKLTITPKDIAEIHGLKELREAIQKVEEQGKKAVGRRKYLLKRQLIQMRQDQYVMKSEFRKPIYFTNGIKSFTKVDFNDNIDIIYKGHIIEDKSLISFFNPKHLVALLNNYSKLKQSSWGKFWTDSYYLMQDLDDLIERTLKEEYPKYYDILIYKIDKESNENIQKLLEEKYGSTYSLQYISALWRNKIPKLLAKKAEEDYITWYFTVKERGSWKKCSRCGQIKLRDSRFFSKNKTSSDGWYSMCKECRNRKKVK